MCKKNPRKKPRKTSRAHCASKKYSRNLKYISVFDYPYIEKKLKRVGRSDVVRLLGTQESYVAVARLFIYNTGKKLDEKLDLFKLGMYVN